MHVGGKKSCHVTVSFNYYLNFDISTFDFDDMSQKIHVASLLQGLRESD